MILSLPRPAARLFHALLLTLFLAPIAPTLPPAHAADSDLKALLEGSQFDQKVLDRTKKAKEAAETVRLVLYVIAAVMLMAIGAAAWAGRMKWAWLAALLGGCLIIALSGYIVGYLFVDAPSTT